MKSIEPPRWMERTLKFLLQPRNRETICGDLYEEFREEKFPSLGRARAEVWYMRQVLSFIPQKFGFVLTAFCLFTTASGGWLGMMDIILHHPGYAQREWIAALIVGQAAVTLAALHLRSLAWLRPLALVGCAAIAWLAGHALWAAINGTNFEGYILLISLGLLVQAALTLMILPGISPRLARRA
jgi:hypothetical protein